MEAYKTCIKNSGGKPITVRTCDWAADDCGQWMDGMQTRMEEETTALTQLSALMQAAVEAPEGALQVLFPMIPDVDAWRTRMDQMKRCNESLKEKGLPFCGNLPVGCLIEIPAAALMAGEIIDAGADFLAVDLDDLVQYTCGVSRREKPTPADNPAVLRLVQDMMHAAQTRGVPAVPVRHYAERPGNHARFHAHWCAQFLRGIRSHQHPQKHSDANRTIKISPHPLPPAAYDKGAGRIFNE